MSITFGHDGTLYCNTVKYNWKQARNLIADGCYANTSGAFNLSEMDIVTDQGYKTYRSFHFYNAAGTRTSMMTQAMPKPIANHKYYGALRWKTAGSSFSAADDRFEWYNSDTSNGMMVFARKNIATNGQWVLLSSIQSLSSVASGSWQLRNFTVNSTDDSWCTRLMIIDLTDTFGAGNEPTKEWCDANIREHETYVNFGSHLSPISNSNFSNTYAAQQGSCKFQEYLYWDATYRPREYTVLFASDANRQEGYLQKKSNMPALDPAETYYASMETCYTGYPELHQYQCYWPIAEPSMGSVPLVEESLYNGGRGMDGWKRASFFANRSSFSAGKYPMRWDFDNVGRASTTLSTGHQICKVSSNINQYNKYNGTNITVGDVNKEWCDRWIDNRGFSYVHIKDPNNTEIRITPDSEIICNDIEIRPEVNTITFRPDGTIVCKKLVKSLAY